jgi:hypothetical protein
MLSPELLGKDLADLFDEATPELTLDEVRDRAFQSGPVRHSRRPRPAVVALGAFLAVLFTGLLVGALTQPWDRQAPAISQPEIISPDHTDTTAAETTAAPPVALGVSYLWPETPQNDTPSGVAEDFAASVLGWQNIEDVWASEHSDGVTWVRIQRADSPEEVDVATTPSPDGNHVIVEAGHGVELAQSETGGITVGLAMVPEASEAEIIIRMLDGTYEVETVALDPDNPGPVDAELPQLDPSSIGSVLVRYRDETGQVIRINGTSTPEMDQASSLDERRQLYIVDGEQLLATNPTVVIGAQSPEPRFDTSDLGEEVTLTPITDVAKILREAAHYPHEEIIRITVLGTTPEGTDALVVYANSGWNEETAPTQYRYMVFGDEMVGSGSLLSELTNAPGGLVPRPVQSERWTPADQEGRPYVWWHVATDVSVVVMNFNGEQKWQRPIDGAVIFTFEPPSGVEFTYLNSIGEIIGGYGG